MLTKNLWGMSLVAGFSLWNITQNISAMDRGDMQSSSLLEYTRTCQGTQGENLKMIDGVRQEQGLPDMLRVNVLSILSQEQKDKIVPGFFDPQKELGEMKIDSPAFDPRNASIAYALLSTRLDYTYSAPRYVLQINNDAKQKSFDVKVLHVFDTLSLYQPKSKLSFIFSGGLEVLIHSAWGRWYLKKEGSEWKKHCCRELERCRDLYVSKDGKKCAVAMQEGVVFCDGDKLFQEKFDRSKDYEEEFRVGVFTPDNKKFVLGGLKDRFMWREGFKWREEVEVVEVEAGKLLKRFKEPESLYFQPVLALSCHTQTGDLMVVRPELVQIYDSGTYELKKTVELAHVSSLRADVRFFTISPDHEVIACRNLKGYPSKDTIVMWDSLTGALLWEFDPKSEVHSLVFSHDGTRLAAGLDKNEVVVFSKDSSFGWHVKK